MVDAGTVQGIIIVGSVLVAGGNIASFYDSFIEIRKGFDPEVIESRWNRVSRDRPLIDLYRIATSPGRMFSYFIYDKLEERRED
jgi:hypothetical protein